MINIKNTDTIKNLINATGVNVQQDIVPSKLSETVVAVMDIGPNNNRVGTILNPSTFDAANTAALTLATTDTTRDTYVTGAMLSVIKDATATSTRSAIVVTINGLQTRLISIPGFTLTAQNQSVFLAFPAPIKLDKGSNITATNTTAVGNVTASAIIYGYNVNPSES
jgi:hypothetical protein